MARATVAPMMMRRLGNALVPCSLLDAEFLAERVGSKAVRVQTVEPRSGPRNRLYWAMLRLICANLDPSPTDKKLHEAIKYRLGYTTPVKFKSGETVEVVDSTAYDAMTEDEHREFFRRFVDLVETQIIPGIDSAALEREARAMLAGGDA